MRAGGRQPQPVRRMRRSLPSRCPGWPPGCPMPTSRDSCVSGCCLVGDSAVQSDGDVRTCCPRCLRDSVESVF